MIRVNGESSKVLRGNLNYLTDTTSHKVQRKLNSTEEKDHAMKMENTMNNSYDNN